MKNKNLITVLVLIIAVLSLLSSVLGVMPGSGPGKHDIKTIYGETVTLYGSGMHANDSVSTVTQGTAQDIITVVLAIPLLLIAIYFSRKGSLKGRLLLTGTLGYFLYTYVSYTFLWTYCPLFLLYVTLMSLSFFTFVALMMSFDMVRLSHAFKLSTPVKLIGGFQIFFSVMLAMLWIGKIVPTMMDGKAPAGLEHYTTLVIQGMDLGFIVPAAFISGLLIIKRKPLGYLLSSVIILNGVSMGTTILAMLIGQALAGAAASIAEYIVFPVIILFIVFCLVLILKNIDEPSAASID